VSNDAGAVMPVLTAGGGSLVRQEMLCFCGFGDAVFENAFNGVRSHAMNLNDQQELSGKATPSPAGTEMVVTGIQGTEFRIVMIYLINKDV